MNHPQYQRHSHPSNTQHLYQNPTDDEMKPFKIAQILKQQQSIQNLDNKELAEYCHNQWKQWMATLLELKDYIDKEENVVKPARQHQEKKPSINQPNRNESMLNFSQPNQQTMQPQQMMYPPFYSPSFQDVMHSQNIQNMNFMRNNQTQSRQPFMPQNVGRSTFPFPFNPQQMQINQGNQQSQAFNQGQIIGTRPMMGQQSQQMHNNDGNK